MRNLVSLSCISLLALCGCAGPSDGYYDANGNYVSNHPSRDYYAPAPAGAYAAGYDDPHHVYKTTTTTYTYDRPGYYDYNGYYVSENGMAPEDQFPPHGMCRVWFPNRAPVDQPDVESCDGIRVRVPSGAYVIYGG